MPRAGLGVVLGVGLLVALQVRGWRRVVAGVAAAGVGVAVLLGTQAGVMAAIDAQRAEVTGLDGGALPVAHGTWHPLYLGLAYSGAIGEKPSVLGILWNDAFGWGKARQVDPDVVVRSREYDAIIKDFYLAEVRAHPKTVAVMYAQKAGETVRQNLFVFAAIVVGLAVLWRRPATGPALRRAALLLVPAIAYGLAPPTLVMPMRYYFMELSAAIGLLLAVVVAAVAAATARNPRTEPATEERETGRPDAADDDAARTVVTPVRS